MSKFAKLEIDNTSISLPVIEGTAHEKAIDISSLRKTTGLVTLDNGYVNTASCQSEVTFLNGEEGVLQFRGYSIEELASRSDFLEVCYLLIYGELPSATELAGLQERINTHGYIPDNLKKFFSHYPKDAHPMGVLTGMVASLTAFNPEFLHPFLESNEKDTIIAKLLAKLKIIAAHTYRSSRGLAPVDSRDDLSFSADFLNMMFAEEGKSFDIKPEIEKALDLLLILHADHEQNCSASTVRLVGSSNANLFASISSGICALWGPLHGGANQAVIEMMEAIQKDGGGYKKFLAKAKDKTDTFRLMGFGHRVYKNFDPRAKIIKKACDDVLGQLGIHDPILEIAKGLEEAALEDSYFVERKLYPNVDFYSGIIYRAIGIPTNMFTVMFALGRLPGWIAQWKEQIEHPDSKIGRPRQIYQGKLNRSYTPLSDRN